MPLKRPRHSRTLFQFPLAFASIGLLSLALVGLHGQEHVAPNQFLTVTESGIFPGKLSIASGGTAVLQITNAPPDATFQWSFENLELPGQTNAHLVLRNIQPPQAGAYHATISTAGQSFRSSATVSVLTTLNDGLVAHWPLDGTAQDTSGKGHHGTLKNVANVSDRFGSAAGALEFNGTSSVIEVPDSSDFAFGAGDLTISYWLKQPTDFKSDGAILGQSAAPQAPDEWIFHPRPFVSFAAESMSGYFLYGAEIATVDAWMHCTLTRQGSSWNFYLDGKLFSTATFERSLPDVPGILTIGAAGGRAYLRGTLDQLRIYRRSLTQDEIEALFLSESPQWLAITMQPVGGSFSAGQTVTLNAAVTGLDPISLQWLRNDQPVAGANSARLNLDRATPLLSGAYALVASNAAGSVTSQVAQVTITWPLSFTKLAPAPFTSPDFGASGCAWADFDNDGLLDFFASSGNGNRYYRNEGNGVLKELFASGATDGAGALVACGDYNNDGFTDLFVAKRWGKNFLYRNNGNHTFTRVLDVAPVEAEGDHVSGAWGDYDNDGWLDLFVATVSGNNQLFRNNKDGSFERVDTGPVANDGGVSITAAWGDYNNDSFLDLYVVNDLSQPNFLYRNNRDGTFERILDIAPMQRNWNAAACIWGDYDNNGFLDLFVSDYQAANALFHNNAGETFTDASSAGVNLRSVNGSFSAVWADFNKDGHLDLFAGSATAPHFLHLNRGDGAFLLITNLPPVLEASGAYSVAAADYDNDGDEDLFSTGGNVLFLNNGSSSHWLSVTLRGRISNRSGIGAKVKVTADVDGKTFQQMREISGGNGRSGQNGLRAFFGLGSASVAGNLTIEWPSGIVDAYTNVPVDRLLTAEEGGTRLIVRTLGNGTIERLPDLPSYLVGSEVTVTARPDPLYEFVRWSDGETNPTRKIIVSAGPNTITAIFASTISITRDVLATSEHIFGGTAIDRLMTVRSTAEGGLVLAGSSDSSSSGNKGVSGFGNLDFWIFQLAPTGKKQWESVFGGSSLDELVAAIPTRDGGYLLGGSSRSAPSGNKSSTHFGDTDFWVVKLDRDGNKQWEGNFGGTDKEVFGALAQTLDGGYLLAGTSDSDASGNKSASGGDFEDGWLVKLDSRGNKLWDKAFARGFFEHFAAVAATEDGGCVVAGDSAPGDSYDFWIVKLRSDGSIQWERTFGGNQFDVARLIQPTSDGGYVVAGVSLSSISESKTTDGYGEADFWVLKLDANGGKQWERTFGGSARDEIHALHQTVDGGFLLAGDTSSGISGIKTTPNAGGSDWWLMRIDFNGDLIWQNSFGGPDDDFLNTMQRTLLGCALGGSTGQNLGGSRRVAGFGNRDFWLLQTAFIETPEGTPIVRVNGLYSPVHRHEFLTLNEVEISMTTSFPNGAIYYTTDGTIADFLSPTSTRYTVPFRVAPGSVIQAIAYDGDPEIFYEREQSLETPVQIVFVPSYLLSDITPGGGAALFDPPGGSYPSNSVVTVTAQAAPGWQFLRWEGDATGTEVRTTVRMDQPRSVKAIFGTEIVSRVSGTGGTVSNNPSIGPYPYGSRMWVSALPAAGRFFSRWTITSPTTTNQVLDLPLALTVTNAFQTNSAFFGNIGTGRALTLFVNGAGSIQRTPAQQTAYLPNQEVTLTAVPDPGFTFAGWSGDEISNANPLAIVLTTNKTITAAFGRIPEVLLAEPSHESSHRVTHQLSLVADATDPDGFVKVIHFYSQDPRDNYAPKLITSISNFERLPGGVFRASIKVPQLRKGTYRIVAVAVDELGLESISTPADITVFAEPGDVLAEFVAGEGMSFAPAIGSDGTVYVGAGVYGRSRGKLIALDENLVEKWSLEFGDPNGGIGNSPAIAPDGTIYISSGATLFGFGPDKSPRGEFKTGPHFITAMPAFGADGTIYIGAWDNHFYAFDPRTGETNAMRNLGSIIIHPAAIGADGTIYVHGFDTNKLFALGPDLSIRNEHVLTRAGDFLGGPPVIGRDGTIYMSTGYGLLALSSNLDFKWDGIFANGLAPVLDAEGTVYQTGGSLRAFNPDGSDKSGWAFTAPGYTTSSAAIDAAGNLYVTGDDGLIYGIKPDGSVLWEFQRETTQLLSSSSFSPNLGRNGVIYVGSNQGKLFALQASAELAPNSPWPMLGKNQKHNGNAHGLPGDMLNSFPLGDLVRSSVAIGVDGKKYIGAGNSLFVFSADDAVTSFDLKRNLQSSPVLGPDGTIYVAGDYGTPEGRLMAFDSTGTELWHLDLESAVGRASPALGSDGTVWITSGGKLYSTNAAMNIGRVLDLREALELASLSTQSSPVIGPNGMVYVAAANLLVAIRPDQTIEWTFEATHDPGDGNLFLLVSPAIGADGTIYVVTLHGWLYAIAPQGTERWRTKVDYLCYSSPIIGPDDTVYLTSSHEQFELHAFRGLDGKSKWSQPFTLPAAYSYSVPALGLDGTVYFAAGKSLYAVSDAGDHAEFRWEFRTRDDILSSPVLTAEGEVWVGSDDGNLYVIRAASGPAESAWPMFRKNPQHTGNAGALLGEKLWSFQTEASIGSSPAITRDGVIIFGGGWEGNGHVYAVEPWGRPRWTNDLSGAVFTAPLISPDGTIYVSASGGEIYALDPADGRVKDRFPTGGFPGPLALGADGTLYFGSDDGKIYALNASLEKRWEFQTGGPVRSSPVVGVTGNIFVNSTDGKLYALTPSGERIWSYTIEPPFAQIPLSNSLEASVGVDGTIYVGSRDGQLHAVSASGTNKWTFTANATVFGGPVVSQNGNIFFGDINGFVYALDADGKELRRLRVDGGVYGSLALTADGHVLAATITGHVYAITPSATFAWHFKANDCSDQFYSGLAIGADGTVYATTWSCGRLLALKGTSPLASGYWPMYRRDLAHTGNATGGNHPPSIALTRPIAGERFGAPAIVNIEATAADPENALSYVEFFVNTISIGRDEAAPFAATARLEAGGDYAIVARVADDQGLFAETAPITITVTNVPPAIVAQPQDTIVGIGAEARFTVEVTGSAPLSYEWFFNKATIPGATGATLLIPNANISDVGKYSVTITNIAGSVSSREAMLSVVPLTELRTDFYVTDGPVHAISAGHSTVYVGGSFSNVWAQTGSGAVVNPKSGLPDPLFPRVDGEIHAVISDGQGGWFIGGNFTKVGALDRQGLAHLLPNGTVDTNWTATANRVVRALARIGERVFVGGQFTNVNGALRNRLAALDARNGQLIGNWNPNADAPVLALAANDTTVYIGGEFLKLGEITRNHIAAVHALTGAVEEWNPDADKTVFALALSAQTLYAGGSFNNIGRQPNRSRTGLAALSLDTAVASLWNPEPNAAVRALAIYNHLVVAGGDFTMMGGRNQNFIAAFDPSALIGSLRDWNPLLNNSVTALAVSGDTLYAGGQFTDVKGLPRQRAAAFQAQTGALLDWHPDLDHHVLAIAAETNQVYLGGRFTVAGRRARLNTAAFDLATGIVTDWNPQADGQVFALLASGTNVFVGGKFNALGRATGPNFAVVDPILGTRHGPQLGVDGAVFALVESDTFVFLGGSFATVNGEPRSRLASYSPSTGTLRAWSPVVNQNVLAMAPGVDRIFVAGDFTAISGIPVGQVAALPSLGENNVAPVLWNPDANGDPVRALALGPKATVAPSSVFAGGSFSVIGGQLRERLAALDFESGKASGWDPKIAGSGASVVHALAATSDRLYVGGQFETAANQSRTNLAAFHLSSAAATPQLLLDFAPDPNGAVRAVTTSGNQVFIGGDFQNIGRQPRSYFAVIGPNGPPVITLQPKDQAVPSGTTVSFEIAALGQEPLSFQWLFNNETIADATNRVLTLPRVTSAQSGAYQVRVQNRRGDVLSDAAQLKITSEPAEVISPGQSFIVLPGASVTLTAEVVGTLPIRYQWRRNGVNLPGATEPTLVLANVIPEDSGSYTLVVHNAFGADISPIFSVLVRNREKELSDQFVDRARANTAKGTVFGNNVDAQVSTEPGEETPLRKLGGRSVWFSWIAPASGLATINTRGSTFDTLLGVYTGTLATGLQLVAEDDDSGGFLTSEVVFNVVGGTEYQIVVSSYGSKSGDVVLNWDMDPTILGGPQITRAPFSQTISEGQSAAFTVQVSGQGNLSFQWLLNGQIIPGASESFLVLRNVDRDDVGSYQVRVSAANGLSALSAPATLQLNRTDTGGADTKVVSKDKLGDSIQLVAEDVLPGPNARLHGRGRLHGSPFGAAPARGFSGMQILDTTLSQKQEGEQNHCGIAGGASEWFTILAEDDTGLMRVSTEGSNFNTVLAVYEGPENAIAFDELYSKDCDKDSGADGKTSVVVFKPDKGVIYHIAVDGENGERGKVQLSYGLEPIITQHPASLTIAENGSATFQVVSTGKPFYQWLFESNPIPGATNASLTLPAVSLAQQGAYTVRVSNHAWTKTSAAAQLTIQPASPLVIEAPAIDANGQFRFRVSGGVAPGTVIQVSTNLQTWDSIFTNTLPLGPFDFIEQTPAGSTPRFYRGRR